MSIRTQKAALLPFLVLAAVPGAAGAQSTSVPGAGSLEEIVVTAQRRAENVQEVPIAITALTSDALAEHHVTSVMDLAGLAPGLDIRRSDNSAIPKIFMRGVGLNDFNPTTASAVAIYEDGVYISSPLSQMAQFFDLERVEVLRGPQGTLYGRNTTGGAINLITRAPGNAFSADSEVRAGNFSSLVVEGGIGGPIVKDVLSARLAVNYEGDSGYVRNRLTGQRGDDAGNWTARLTLKFTPGDLFNGTLMVHYGENHGASIWGHSRQLLPAGPQYADPSTGFCAQAYFYTSNCTDVLGYFNPSPDLYSGDFLFKGRDVVKSFGSALTLQWNLPGLTLVSTTGFFHTQRNDREETDYSPDQLINSLYLQKNQSVSEEIRLLNSDSGPAKWVAGLYAAHDYISNNSWYDILRPLRSAANPDPNGCFLAFGICLFNWPNSQTTNSYAAFGQYDYKITRALTGTVGLRYSTDHKSFEYTSCADFCSIVLIPTVTASKSFNSVTGRLGVEYALTPDFNLYATYNRGVKSGGFFDGQTASPGDLTPYSDEKLNAYELGAKTDWLDHRLRANVAAFWYDYRDLQAYTFVVRNNVTAQTLKNASNARIYGADAELAATPVQHLELTLSAEALHARYIEFITVANPIPQCVGVTVPTTPQCGNYSGNTLPAAPSFSVSTSVRYELPPSVWGGHFSVYLDERTRTKIYYETRNVPRLSDPTRTWVNAEVGWRSAAGRFELGFWGRNIFNETNIIEIDPIEGLGEDEFTMGKPRTYGIYLRAHVN